MSEELLVSSGYRNFMVQVESKPGLSHPLKTILYIKARGIKHAKDEALKSLRTVGRYAQRGHSCWIFRVEEIKDERKEDEGSEPGHS